MKAQRGETVELEANDDGTISVVLRREEKNDWVGWARQAYLDAVGFDEFVDSLRASADDRDSAP